MQFSFKMKGTLILLVIIVAVPFMFVNSKTMNEDETSIEAGIKDWTVLVYMCGDNNLEFYALEDLNEMEASGGTTADVNIVTMVDRCAYPYETPEYDNDWSEARYYTIVGDGDIYTFSSPMNVSLGEKNMGLSQTLDDFLNWGLTNYPAEKTALILWDHGGGLDGVCWDEDNGDDNLLVDELSEALDGYYFDFLGFDACVMGQFEVLYEMRNFCEIFVASMLNEPGYGWNYYDTFASLIADPTMSASELAQHACADYVDYYSIYDVDVTLSAYNTSKFQDIDSLVDDFSLALIDSLDTHAMDIFDARMASNSELFPDALCDLQDFLINVQSISDAALITAADALETRLNEILVVSESSFITDPYGLWFMLPSVPYEYYNDFYIYSNQSIVNSYYNYYFGLDFVNNTLWDNFLYQWKIELETLIPQVSTSTPYTDSLISGSLFYIYADLPNPGIGYGYQATLTMDASVDFDLYVWSEEHYFGLPNGFEVFSENMDDDPEVVLFMINDITRVFFLIHAYSDSGSYTLTLEVVEYNDDIYEENDDFESAIPIDVNAIYTLIAYDMDFFIIELTSGVTVEMTLTFNGAVCDLDLYLFADDQATMLDYSEGYGSTEYISYTAPYTGIYYVLMNFYSGLAGEEYELEINVNEDPVVTNYYHSPYSPEPGESITIYCYVNSIYPIEQVTLCFYYDGGSIQFITMTNQGAYYSAVIVPPEGTDIVTYFVYVEDNQGNHIATSSKYIFIDNGPEPSETDLNTSTTVDFPWLFVPLMILGLVFVNRLFILKKR